MINKKTESIQGFLTPTKLLSSVAGKYSKQSKANSAAKSPLSQSTLNHPRANPSNSQKTSLNNSSVNPSINYLSRLENSNETYSTSPAVMAESGAAKGTINFPNHHVQQKEQEILSITPNNKKYSSMIETNPQSFEAQHHQNSNKKRESFPIIQEDENHHQSGSLDIRQIEEGSFDGKSSGIYNRHKTNENSFNLSRNGHEVLRDSLRGSREYQEKGSNFEALEHVQMGSHKKQVTQSHTPKPSSNPEIMSLQCYELIRKLSKVKDSLELEISELQRLLDNTSKYMEDMDEEFDRLKQYILTYTSKCLDSAFTEYKQTMVNWKQYEDFEKKSLQILGDLNESIYDHEQSISEKLSPQQITAVTGDLQTQIDHYTKFALEVGTIRRECVNMRPTVTQEMMRGYEIGLLGLCKF